MMNQGEYARQKWGWGRLNMRTRVISLLWKELPAVKIILIILWNETSEKWNLRRTILEANKVGILGVRKLRRKNYNNLGLRWYVSAEKDTKKWQKQGKGEKKSSLKEKTKNWNNLTRYWTWTVKTRKRLKDHSKIGIRNIKGSESVNGKDVNQRCLFKRKMVVGDTVTSSVSKYQVI